MKFNKLANSNSTGPTLKSSSQGKGQGQVVTNRNPNFQSTNPTSRIVNHPALISNQTMRDGPNCCSSTFNQTGGQQHVH